MNALLPAGLGPAQLTALVFELATQLHAERAHRLALELALEQAQILSPAATAAASRLPEAQARSRYAADVAIRKLLRVATTAAPVQFFEE